jgi:hypothetical protein
VDLDAPPKTPGAPASGRHDSNAPVSDAAPPPVTSSFLSPHAASATRDRTVAHLALSVTIDTLFIGTANLRRRLRIYSWRVRAKRDIFEAYL